MINVNVESTKELKSIHIDKTPSGWKAEVTISTTINNQVSEDTIIYSDELFNEFYDSWTNDKFIFSELNNKLNLKISQRTIDGLEGVIHNG